MNRGKGQVTTLLGGYTIVETLIFLAVSSAMFVMAMAFVSGQQNKAQFVNAVRDFEQQLTDIANNVSTGYYEIPSGLTCDVDATYTPVVPGTAGSGKCILAGVAIKLGNVGPGFYSTMTLVGSKVNSSGVDVHSLVEARPVVVNSTINTRQLLNGAKIGCISKNSSPCSTGNAAVGFFSKLTGAVTEDAGKNNIIRTDLLPYPRVNINDSAAAAVAKMNANIAGIDYSNADLSNASNINPQVLRICILSGTTNQYAQIKITGAATGSLSISSEIFGGTVCS